MGELFTERSKKLFPNNEQTISDIGEKYLCKKMYWYSFRRQGPVQRCKDYLKAYKTFSNCYSPSSYTYQKSIRPRIARLVSGK